MTGNRFLEHGLQGSMIRRGNCHDNAEAESFFQLPMRQRIRRQNYATRDAARSDVFDYIEVFYNNKRRHSTNNKLSPEKLYQQRLESVKGNDSDSHQYWVRSMNFMSIVLIFLQYGKF